MFSKPNHISPSSSSTLLLSQNSSRISLIKHRESQQNMITFKEDISSNIENKNYVETTLASDRANKNIKTSDENVFGSSARSRSDIDEAPTTITLNKDFMKLDVHHNPSQKQASRNQEEIVSGNTLSKFDMHSDKNKEQGLTLTGVNGSFVSNKLSKIIANEGFRSNLAISTSIGSENTRSERTSKDQDGSTIGFKSILMNKQGDGAEEEGSGKEYTALGYHVDPANEIGLKSLITDKAGKQPTTT